MPAGGTVPILGEHCLYGVALPVETSASEGGLIIIGGSTKGKVRRDLID